MAFHVRCQIKIYDERAEMAELLMIQHHDILHYFDFIFEMCTIHLVWEPIFMQTQWNFKKNCPSELNKKNLPLYFLLRLGNCKNLYLGLYQECFPYFNFFHIFFYWGFKNMTRPNFTCCDVMLVWCIDKLTKLVIVQHNRNRLRETQFQTDC